MDRLVLGGKNKATGRAEFVVGSWLVRRMVGSQAAGRAVVKGGCGFGVECQFEEGCWIECLMFGEKSETAGFSGWKRGRKHSFFEERSIAEG